VFFLSPSLSSFNPVPSQFIRARKWVLDDALKMFLNALKWRIVERLDELIELSDVELDAKYPKFLEQMRMGKGYLRGADPLGRPMSVIHTRLHHKSDQPPETIHRFTLYVSSLFSCCELFFPFFWTHCFFSRRALGL
jgi:hypothetical protein